MEPEYWSNPDGVNIATYKWVPARVDKIVYLGKSALSFPNEIIFIEFKVFFPDSWVFLFVFWSDDFIELITFLHFDKYEK